MHSDKAYLSERDICTKFILPALEAAGWDRQAQLFEEFPLRVGRVVVRGNKGKRDPGTVRRADYVLFHKPGIPLAVLCLNSPFFTNGIDPGRSNGIPHISTKQIEALHVPVPSLGTQSGIVTAVASLTALCDRLRERLAARRDLSAKLAGALTESALA
jgi:hypothetical protein